MTLGKSILSVEDELKAPIGALSGESGVSVGTAATVFLKVHLYSTLEIKQTTIMQMAVNITMSEVFKQICVKRKYDLKDYILKMADTKTDVPLDQTLDQLKATEFCVLKKSSGGAGDIFLRPPDEDLLHTKHDKPILTLGEYRVLFKVYISHAAILRFIQAFIRQTRSYPDNRRRKHQPRRPRKRQKVF